MSRADFEAGVRAGLEAAGAWLLNDGYLIAAKRMPQDIDPAAIAATVPESDELAALRQENSICRDAVEDAVILVTSWCETHDSDSDAACGRVALRQLSEAIGKAIPRLLMERPEGQKLYGLHWKELHNELSALRRDIEAYRGALGYSVSGDHDGRLSDGTFPVNGIAEALRRDAEYYEWRLGEIIPLFEEARDALQPLTVVQCRLHNISLSLADRMDAAGTRTRSDFDAAMAISTSADD